METRKENDKLDVNHITKTYDKAEKFLGQIYAVVMVTAVASFAGFGAVFFFEGFIAPPSLSGAEFLFAMSTVVSFFALWFGIMAMESLRLWNPDLFDEKRAILTYEVVKDD